MVVLYGIVTHLFITVLTVWVVRIIGVVRVVVVNQCSAFGTVDVIVLITTRAERMGVSSFCLVPPDSFKTAFAYGGEFVKTLSAHDGVVEFTRSGFIEQSSAEMAYNRFGHG